MMVALSLCLPFVTHRMIKMTPFYWLGFGLGVGLRLVLLFFSLCRSFKPHSLCKWVSSLSMCVCLVDLVRFTIIIPNVVKISSRWWVFVSYCAVPTNAMRLMLLILMCLNVLLAPFCGLLSHSRFRWLFLLFFSVCVIKLGPRFTSLYLDHLQRNGKIHTLLFRKQQSEKKLFLLFFFTIVSLFSFCLSPVVMFFFFCLFVNVLCLLRVKQEREKNTANFIISIKCNYTLNVDTEN